MNWRFWKKEPDLTVTVQVDEATLTGATSYFVKGPDENTTLRVLERIKKEA